MSSRIYSIFDPSSPTNRDRVAMLRYGSEMVRDHPLTGVGNYVRGSLAGLVRP